MSYYIDFEKTADGELRMLDMAPMQIDAFPVGRYRVAGHVWGNGGSLSVQYTTTEGRALVASITYPNGDLKPPF